MPSKIFECVGCGCVGKGSYRIERESVDPYSDSHRPTAPRVVALYECPAGWEESPVRCSRGPHLFCGSCWEKLHPAGAKTP